MSKALILIIILTSWSNLSAQIDFFPALTYDSEQNAEVVKVADLNNDGLNDVVMGIDDQFTNSEHKLFVYIQNENGELNSPVEYVYPVDTFCYFSIDVADINNDQLNDVVVGFTDSVKIFIQNQEGTLEVLNTFYSGAYVQSVKCGDLNNDGLNDIAVGNFWELYIRVFYQNEDGFSSVDYPKLNSRIKNADIGDVNNDGLNDLIFPGGGASDGLSLYTQNENGSLNDPLFYYPQGPWWYDIAAVAMGDLNNDGLLDIAGSGGIGDNSSDLVLWFQDPITNTLENPPIQIPCISFPQPIKIADMNCDSVNDIVILHSGGTMTVHEQNEYGVYVSSAPIITPYSTHYERHGMSIGDLNNDGKNDVAIASYNFGLVVMINNSTPSEYQITEITSTIDTTFSHDIIESEVFVFNNNFTEDDYFVYTQESYVVAHTYHEDSIRVDSVFYAQEVLCGEMFFDTTYTTTYFYDHFFISIDTLNHTFFRDSTNLIGILKLYPNPTDGIISMELPDGYISEELKILIYNEMGELVKIEMPITNLSNKSQFDIGELASGIYFIHLSVGEDRILKQKVIKH